MVVLLCQKVTMFKLIKKESIDYRYFFFFFINLLIDFVLRILKILNIKNSSLKKSKINNV